MRSDALTAKTAQARLSSRSLVLYAKFHFSLKFDPRLNLLVPRCLTRYFELVNGILTSYNRMDDRTIALFFVSTGSIDIKLVAGAGDGRLSIRLWMLKSPPSLLFPP